MPVKRFCRVSLAANQGDSDAKIALTKYEELEKNRITEAKRIDDEKLKAEQAVRVAEEAKLKAEEIARTEKNARLKAERNARIAYWFAAFIGLLSIFSFFVYSRKHRVEKKEYPEKYVKTVLNSDFRSPKTNCLKCGYQRTPSDISPETTCPKCGAVYAKVEATLAKIHHQQAKTQKTVDPVLSSEVGTRRALQEEPNPIGIVGSLENVTGSQTDNSSASIAQPDVDSPKTALSTCKECGKSVSFKAKICPNCGASKPASKVTNSHMLIVLAITSIGVLAPIVYFLTPAEKERVHFSNSEKKNVKNVEADSVLAVQAVVRSFLKDPDSAKFGNLIVINPTNACIPVNAKNAFGGYTGEKYFSLIKGNSGQWVLDDGLSSADLHDGICRLNMLTR